MAAKIESGEIVFDEAETKITRKIYLDTVEGRAVESIWFGKEVGVTRDAARELKALFDGVLPFDTPKPIGLIERMMQVAGVGNGDIVLVPEMDVFYIYGEVQKPGRYKLERDMTVMQGLSVASGMTPRGSVRGIVLNRLAGNTMTSLDTRLEDRLQPNDVLYVKTAVF